ncbi:helix-turn-helix transcriptional regulator [Mycobacterium sp. CPCC 205372]|uniref:Helix-turn-helix transcriptional regulator n=1 Tax=Mycobacterium hippophais TaxID=3016340 RepID=A0ABT4PVR6_9MYCO|nr:helix-turn-helix transcriptional regulator [Mycobacterium hippophais]MCZ8380665.1 helix-turn-helix transcriptional regulator [Mycobacterium hippophais]
MVSVDEFSKLVDAAYAAAAVPAQWHSVLTGVGRTLGGNGAALLTSNGPVWTIDHALLPSEAQMSYAQHYCRVDHTMAALRKGPVGALRTGDELIRPYRNEEFYRDWLHPHGIEDGMFVRLDGTPNPTVLIVHTGKRRTAFATDERVSVMRALSPHLQRALGMRRQLSGAADHAADIVDALTSVTHGVVVIGARRTIVMLNSTAEQQLRAADGLHFRFGRLGADTAGAEHALRRSLTAALFGDQSGIRSGGTLLCERPSGKRA